MNKVNIFSKFNFPEQIGTTIGLVGFVLIVSFIFPDKDFGIIKTPNFGRFNFLALLFGLAFLFTNIPLFKKEKNELVIFKQSKELHAEFKEIIGGINNEAIFWAGNFYLSVNEHKSLLLDRLNNGAKIKYLIFNPYSILCEHASKDFNEKDSNHFFDQCIMTIKNLRDLENEWNELKKHPKIEGGSLEVKLYSNIPRIRAYLIDTEQKNTYSYFIHFLFKMDSSDLPVYKVLNSKSEIIGTVKASFYRLWNDQLALLTLSDFLERHRI